jgi:lipooligosaccharide transport system permease protein
MFLFSGGFYPISVLPHWLQVVVQFVPLYHGVALCRTLALGQGTAAATAYHLAYLLALVAIGTVFCIRNFRRRLEV